MNECDNPSSLLNTQDKDASESVHEARGAGSPVGREGPCPYRAVFFDLDGTLLPMELEDFLGSYFSSIASFVAAHGLDATAFSAGLHAGIEAMGSHEDARTNHDAYWDAFFRHADARAADWSKLLAGYYEYDFNLIGKGVIPNPAAARAIETLFAKGYTLILTTMPMFPRRAVEHRLAWSGVDSSRFARLTSYENSTSVKPKLAYYAENLAACGLVGEDVLMVGNNTVEDVAATKLGTDVYLVTDHLLDTVNFDLSGVKHGSMDKFAAWTQTLPACEHPAPSVDEGVAGRSATAAVLASRPSARGRTGA